MIIVLILTNSYTISNCRNIYLIECNENKIKKSNINGGVSVLQVLKTSLDDVNV